MQATLSSRASLVRGQAVKASRPARRVTVRYSIVTINSVRPDGGPRLWIRCQPYPCHTQQRTAGSLLCRAAGKSFAAYDKESQFFDLNDLENTLGSWDM